MQMFLIYRIILLIELPSSDSKFLYKFVSYQDIVTWLSERHEHSFLKRSGKNKKMLTCWSKYLILCNISLMQSSNKNDAGNGFGSPSKGSLKLSSAFPPCSNASFVMTPKTFRSQIVTTEKTNKPNFPEITSL